ncbi:MAG TPA: M48 family metalloprotease [Pyrinomonadaceae bacterium]
MALFTENQEPSLAKIPECLRRRHLLALLVAILSLTSLEPTHGKGFDTHPVITPQDADEIIAKYRVPAAAKQVALWRAWSRATYRPVRPEFREAAINLFPPAWRSRHNTDPAVARELRSLLRPVFSLYEVDYELYLINTPKPSLFLDSDAILVLTTGLIYRARSDDELLGLVAHEVAHARFGQRTAAAKALIDGLTATGRSQSQGARQALRELSVIELECDAVATRTLVALGLEPREFVKGIQRVQVDYPEETKGGDENGVDWHPPIALRLRVVTELAGPGGPRNRLAKSARLTSLQNLFKE